MNEIKLSTKFLCGLIIYICVCGVAIYNIDVTHSDIRQIIGITMLVSTVAALFLAYTQYAILCNYVDLFRDGEEVGYVRLNREDFQAKIDSLVANEQYEEAERITKVFNKKFGNTNDYHNRKESI